nr:hypothetical protein [Luteimicrobium album]
MPQPSTRATVRAARRRGRGAPALLAVTGLVLVGSLAACTHKPDDTSLHDTAAQLATSLAGGSVDGVALTGATPADATAERKDVFAAVPVRPTVTVKQVARVKDHDDQATATLAWSWPVAAGHPWSYTTTVHLAQGAKDATATSTGSPAPTSSAGSKDAWSVRWDPTVLLPDLADNQHVTFSRVRPQRAKIVDGDGKAIVQDRAVHVIGVDKTRTTGAHWESSARALAKALDLDADAYAKQVSAAGPKAFVEAITLRASDPTDVSKLTAIPGVVALDEKEPLAPTHDWARPCSGPSATRRRTSSRTRTDASSRGTRPACPASRSSTTPSSRARPASRSAWSTTATAASAAALRTEATTTAPTSSPSRPSTAPRWSSRSTARSRPTPRASWRTRRSRARSSRSPRRARSWWRRAARQARGSPRRRRGSSRPARP